MSDEVVARACGTVLACVGLRREGRREKGRSSCAPESMPTIHIPLIAQGPGGDEDDDSDTETELTCSACV